MNDAPGFDRDEEVVRNLLAPLERVQPVPIPKAKHRSRRSRRSYLARRLVPVSVLAAVAFALLLIAPWQHGPGPTVMERALAAIGDEPVLHAVLFEATGNVYIDLASGKETPEFVKTEIWFDRERHLMHRAEIQDGRVVFEVLQTATGYTTNDHSGSDPPPHGQYVDRALAGFLDDYRTELKNGEARVIGTGQIEGREMTWIELAAENGCGIEAFRACIERVAIDRASSLPIRLEWLRRGEVDGSIDIASIEALPEGNGDFSKPKHFSLADARLINLSPFEPVTPTAAAEVLPGALWLGKSFSTLRLERIAQANSSNQPVSESTGEPLAPATVQTGLELRYGSGEPGQAGTGYIWLREAAKPDENFGFRLLTRVGEGSMLVGASGLFPGDSSDWDGLLLKDGMHIDIQASSRDLLIAAARALTPIQPSTTPPETTTATGTMTG